MPKHPEPAGFAAVAGVAGVAAVSVACVLAALFVLAVIGAYLLPIIAIGAFLSACNAKPGR